MQKDEILETLNEIFREVFNDKTISISEESELSDVEGWDSLSQITLIAVVEGRFCIKLNMKEIVSVKYVSEMINIIGNRL